MLTLLSFSFVACEPPAPPIPGQIARNGTVLETVNGQNITQGMVDATLEQLPQNVKDQLLARGQLSQVKDQLVVGELLYQEALKQKLYEKPDIKAALAIAERNALASAVLDQIVEQRTNEEAVKAWYNDHKVQFHKPEAKARHILVKEKGEADAILVQIKAGADFAQLAREKSVDAGSGKEGGDLGWFEKKRMVTEFADAVFAGNKGDIVGPVQTKFGFHIIEIQDRRDDVPVEEAADKIKTQLRQEVIEKYLDELKKGATITSPSATTGGASVAPAGAGTNVADGNTPAPTTP